MLDGLFGNRRSKLLAEPFPEAWVPHASAALPDYDVFTSEERSTLHAHIRLLVEEKNWEGCADLELTDEIRVTIAAQAALLILGLDIDHYERVGSIFVYPDTFVVPVVDHDTGRIVPGHRAEVLGEAVYRGPMVLAWDEVQADVENPGDGRSVVFHEFAHKLDFLDGIIDGTPPLDSDSETQRWRDVCTPVYQTLRDEADRGEETFLDPYGATNETEFFAVVTEVFFDDPAGLQDTHRQLYDLLRDFFRQDPTKRPGRGR